ncbi:MAG: DUF6603 domain-containing protein [Micromonosporaceae bacterium]
MPPDEPGPANDVLSRLAGEAQHLVEPLVRGAQHEVGRRQLLLALGWDLDELTGFPVTELAQAAEAIGGVAVQLAEAARTPPADLGDVAVLIDRIAALIDAVRALQDLADAPTLDLPPDIVAALGSIGQSLVEFLLLEYLTRYHPVAHDLARALTLVQASGDYLAELTPPLGGENGQPVYRLPAAPPRFHLKRLADLITDPAQTLRAEYLGPDGLSTVAAAREAASRIYRRIAPLLVGLGVGVSDGADAPGAVLRDGRRTLELKFPLSKKNPGLAMGALLQLLSDEEGGACLAVTPTGWANFRFEGRSWAVEFVFGGQIGEFSIGRTGVTFPSGAGALKANAIVERVSEGDPTVIGAPAGTRIELEHIRVNVGVDLHTDSWDVALDVDLDHGALVVGAGDGDGFLREVLPAQGLRTEFDLGIGWSRSGGLRLRGGASLDAVVPVHQSLGPITIESVSLLIHASAETPTAPAAVPIEVCLDATVSLGPLTASIEKAGLRAELTFPAGGGNLGPAELTHSFRPPNGVALSIDAASVVGGGFLFFDPANEQYAGGLHLEFEGLTLNAIGLLTTHLPDGSRGFSLLVIVQASGFSPIPLGLGFTLNGVGGLLGINRTVAVDVLRAGVRNKTLDSILFSQDDPTPRAPAIISTLQTVFPPAVNQYVIGPMALIGWGTPTLITIELAVILELPAPLRLIILGRVRATLPDPEHPVVSVNLDVVGVIDFDRRELSVDGSLYDSMVGPYVLTGDLAARANWGENPQFALSLGGFHPAFKPPAGFPALRRLALALSTGDNPRLRMEAYFALTSNTVQVGGQLELYVAASGFSLEGRLGFDTLIQLSPFRLLVDIYAHLALKRGSNTLMGLDVNAHLIGPSPWVVWGEASFKILFVSLSISFRATFGRAEEIPEIQRQEVWPALRDRLTADESWAAQLPPERGQLVVLRAGAGGPELLAHPLGTLTVSQNLVPLDRTLGLFGSVPPKDYDQFEVIGAAGLEIVDTTTQYFAPAQFRRMTDAEKLASPSYERMVSGARLAPHTSARLGYVQEVPLDYEQAVILDVEDPAGELLTEGYTPSRDTVAALAEHGPAGTAELREQGRAKFAPPQPGPRVDDPEFVVVAKDSLTRVPLDRLDGTFTSAAEALRQRPDRDELQIVRAEETQLT